MRMLAVLPFLLTLAVPVDAQDAAPKPAPAGVYLSDPAHTSLTWKISHFGLSNYTARFTGIKARLDWNPAESAQSKLEVKVDPASVRTDFPFPEVEDFDRKIGMEPDFLAGKEIVFVARAIEVTGGATGKVTGDLTFRGETRPVTLDVRFNGSMAEHPMDKKPHLGFSATATVRRTAWGLGFAVPVLGEDVEVLIETEFVPAEGEVGQ
jgi:Uncharacterized conserved protein